ncbi:MAG: MFS transporter [Promethearchaeota archaeon]
MSDKNTAYDLNDKELMMKIKKNPLVWKFCFYGFFKNLKFFEPYLLIIFITWGLNLFTIGILITVREITTYLFEVPSGILADRFGKKTILMSCFIFYILSFIFFFLGPSFYILMIAEFLFGMGDAMRSGTHKAMEMVWMEKNNYMRLKTFIYGRTRSYSLLGSTLSSLVSIVFMLSIPADKWIFIITIIPYIIDFILIATYPSYMNEHKEIKGHPVREFFKEFKGLKVVFTDKRLGRALLSSSSFNAIYKTIKDYIQPIIKLFILALLLQLSLDNGHTSNQFTEAQQDFYIKLILGIIYAIFYLLSSYSSKNAYKFRSRFSNPKTPMDIVFDMLSIILILIGVAVGLSLPIVVVLLYLFIYIFHNLRRPLVVDYLGDIMEKDKRASILSVDSLLKSVLVFIFAPLFGYIAEYVSIMGLFISLGVIFLLINRLYFVKDPGKYPKKEESLDKPQLSD